jgi:hypothetical protein
VILDLQDEIRCLEEKLDEIDLENDGDDRVKSRKNDLLYAKRDGITSPRACLMDILHGKLMKYGTYYGGFQATYAHLTQ